MLTRLTQLVILILFLLQNCSMTYAGESCNILYSAQPPLSIECNPLQLKDLTLQLQCQAIGNKQFAISWYHNNTEGFVRKITRGLISTTAYLQLHSDSDEQTILNNSGYSLNSTQIFSVNSKLAIGEIINSLETESDDFQLFYKSLEGSYWCEVDPEQSTNYVYKKSNVLQLKNINTYNIFPICQGIQSVFETDCAEQKKLDLSSTIVVTPSTYLDVNQTFSHMDPSETTLLSLSQSKATSPSVSPKINSETQQVTTIPESQPSNILSDGKLSKLLNKWETIIICLSAVTIMIMLLIAITIGLYIIYMHKRQRIKIETPIALTKFDNPVYNMSEDYIYPVTTNKEDVEVQYDYMCPKQCIKEDIAIYYTKPIGKSDHDYDDCYERLSDSLKNTMTRDDNKNNVSLSSTGNQYQGLERKTINYLSIYDMVKNKDCSRSNSEENIQSSIIQPPTAILHSNVDREYDYVNIKK